MQYLLTEEERSNLVPRRDYEALAEREAAKCDLAQSLLEALMDEPVEVRARVLARCRAVRDAWAAERTKIRSV